jgi:hypothetical protein
VVEVNLSNTADARTSRERMDSNYFIDGLDPPHLVDHACNNAEMVDVFDLDFRWLLSYSLKIPLTLPATCGMWGAAQC